MLKGKTFLLGFAAVALVLGSGCSLFSDEDDNEMFRIKEGQGANGSGRGGSGSGEASFDNGNSVSGWNNNAINPYGDFGTPIVGLQFDPVYFHFDSSNIDSSETSKLDNVANYLRSHAGTGVVIEGNCDDRGSDEYNRGLGERRALAARDFLVDRGISDSRIRTVSYGEEKPAAPNSDESSRAQNRRDEFVGVTLNK